MHETSRASLAAVARHRCRCRRRCLITQDPGVQERRSKVPQMRGAGWYESLQKRTNYQWPSEQREATVGDSATLESGHVWILEPRDTSGFPASSGNWTGTIKMMDVHDRKRFRQVVVGPTLSSASHCLQNLRCIHTYNNTGQRHNRDRNFPAPPPGITHLHAQVDLPSSHRRALPIPRQALPSQ